eukprot:gb/GECG01005633.1/.p1 GENE.gb/GECG01005633.1/~~gb/GECG01005633.1/.p1  ORF type:complete len:262 (+),score=22.77 gb/GECG01005633.1/:1-786(+)
MPEVVVSGTLKGASGFQNNGSNGRWFSDTWPVNDTLSCYCVWEIIAPSEDWAVVEGDTSGQTHVAECEEDEENTCDWGHPLELTFSTTSMRGWPSLCVSVWTQDFFGRNEIGGYGCIRIPPQPGMHKLEIPTWVPDGTFKERLKRKLIGGGPQLLDSTTVLNPGGNKSALTTSSSGSVHVELNCLFRGFSSQGVVFNYAAGKSANSTDQATYSRLYSESAPSAFGSQIGHLSDQLHPTNVTEVNPELRYFGHGWYDPQETG